MRSQQWRRVGAVGQEVITWANVDPDLCRHMVSLDHNELNFWIGGLVDKCQLQHTLLYIIGVWSTDMTPNYTYMNP